jgi:hypothetical protein
MARVGKTALAVHNGDQADVDADVTAAQRPHSGIRPPLWLLNGGLARVRPGDIAGYHLVWPITVLGKGRRDPGWPADGPVDPTRLRPRDVAARQ